MSTMIVARRRPGLCLATATVASFLTVAMCALSAGLHSARADDSSTSAPAAGWLNVTNDVGGATWGAYGVTYVKAVPGSRDVIAGVSERGLWISKDGGATWRKLGGDEIKNRPGRIVFDPRDRQTFWESGCYGDAPFVTHDGGATFQRLGNLAHADGIAIDFTDRARRTLLLGMHEQSQSLRMSTDGGQTWVLIGDRLPADSNHSTDPIIFDSHTFLINTAGWKQGASLGIYRSTDAGATWVRVSTFGPAGEPLIAPDGAIYWQRIWGGGLLKSADQGRTWAEVSRAVRSNPVIIGAGRLAAFKDRQVFTSDDGGDTWAPLGPPMPFTPTGITYSDRGRCLYAWQLSDNMTRQPVSIVRLDVPRS